MSAELRRLVVLRAEGLATGDDYVDWARAALEAGQDSEHLRMLAALEPYPHWQDVRDYFEWSLEELGLELPLATQIIPEYIRDVARTILSGDVKPNVGLSKIYWALQTDGDHVSQEQYETWLFLEDGLEPGTYRDLRGEDMKRAIFKAAAGLLQS